MTTPVVAPAQGSMVAGIDASRYCSGGAKADKLEALVADTVKKQLVADLPVGALLID